ncbi:hypothetical protein LEP3755_29050 [Leptolyngbya sp. NIES-3755]|nr:hypothetical protein LEP3755_29050 [Leptolyngbya sp. NIES-3755]
MSEQRNPMELSAEELESVAGGAIRKRTAARFSSNLEQTSDLVSATPYGSDVSADALNEEVETDGGSETLVD